MSNRNRTRPPVAREATPDIQQAMRDSLIAEGALEAELAAPGGEAVVMSADTDVEAEVDAALEAVEAGNAEVVVEATPEPEAAPEQPSGQETETAPEAEIPEVPETETVETEEAEPEGEAEPGVEVEPEAPEKSDAELAAEAIAAGKVTIVPAATADGGGSLQRTDVTPPETAEERIAKHKLAIQEAALNEDFDLVAKLIVEGPSLGGTPSQLAALSGQPKASVKAAETGMQLFDCVTFYVLEKSGKVASQHRKMKAATAEAALIAHRKYVVAANGRFILNGADPGSNGYIETRLRTPEEIAEAA